MTPNTASSIPQTLLRSAPQAQHLWKNAHDRAIKTYGDLSRAQRAAFTALKNEFQKNGDRWVPKNGKKPSAALKAQVAPEKAKTAGKTTRATKVAAVSAPAKAKQSRKASSATTRRRQRKTTTNNKTVTRKRSVQRSKK